MEKSFPNYIVFVILLSIFLTFSSSIRAAVEVEKIRASVGQRACQTVQQSCGGMSAYQCCEGLQCIFNGDYPGATGTCMRRTCKTVQQYCGGTSAYQCCEGLRCELDGDYPGSGGVCRPLKPCRRTYQLCGGINRLKCCQGLRCELDDDFPEVAGVCMPGRKCQSDYESCGGSTGLQCCERYACVYDASSYAGDGGVCVPTYKQSSSSK